MPDRFCGEEFSPRHGVVCDAGIMANYEHCEASERTSQINFELKENTNANWCRPCEDFGRSHTSVVQRRLGQLRRSSSQA